MSTARERTGVIAAGLALFSMFFGAGDLIWPLILGGNSGEQTFYAMTGLLITGVSLPLLGLISMMLFEGKYKDFFANVGIYPGIVLVFIIQAILGPIGSIPRLFTLSYATIKPYLPADITLFWFSIIASVVVLLFTIKKQRVIDLLGLILTPILLLSLGAILVIGFYDHPQPQAVPFGSMDAFKDGLNVGYNTLDLIASFIFAPLVLSHFVKKDDTTDPASAKKEMFKKMLKASLLAAGLLSAMYMGLTHVAAYYTPLLGQHENAERLSFISLYLLGPVGALFSCIAVSMACLTTAIPLVAICADYIKTDICNNKVGNMIPLLITLGISGAIANLGFMGIADMLAPVLHILCPGLIVLSILNIFQKLYEVQPYRVPVYAAFGVSGLMKFLTRLG